MGVYSQNVAQFVEASLPVLPVITCKKKPAVVGWQNATPEKSLAWAKQKALGAANGLGVLMGERSGLLLSVLPCRQVTLVLKVLSLEEI